MLRRLLQVQHDRKNGQPQVYKDKFDIDVVLRELERDDTYESDEELDDIEPQESTGWVPDFSIPGTDENIGIESSTPPIHAPES